jgi:hypothetical protein
MRVVGRWNIVKCEKNPGDDLREKYEEESGTEYVCEPRTAGNGFIKSGSKQVIQTGAVVEPCPESCPTPRNRVPFALRLRMHS